MTIAISPHVLYAYLPFFVDALEKGELEQYRLPSHQGWCNACECVRERPRCPRTINRLANPAHE